jgi:hypothetical protein
LGTFPSLLPATFQLSASAQSPASSISYALLCGVLPPGLSLDQDGLITGTPTLVTLATTSTFTVRVTDNLNNLRDRTFSMVVSGAAIPNFTTPGGSLLSVQDSIWVEIPIQYSNPDVNNTVIISLKEGLLPSGLEINESGIIRGYPNPPILNITFPLIATSASLTTASTSIITCLSTTGFALGRIVLFSGTTFGTISSTTTYYVKSIINSTEFTVSTTQNGPTYLVTDAAGYMIVTLPTTSVGQPTIRTSSFTLKLESALGTAVAGYQLTVINQNTPVSQGGPGKIPNSRSPVILNTRPTTFNILPTNEYYGYYFTPPKESSTLTTPSATSTFIGTAQSDNYFAFKIIGKDFDNSVITYSYSGLPSGIIGNTTTGWITGTPILGSTGINQYNFSVAVLKGSFISEYVEFSYKISNGLDGIVTWITPADMGTIYNGTISTLNVLATAQVELYYNIVSGSLPPNLELLFNGEITGYVADQPTTQVLTLNETTDFTFTIRAYSPDHPLLNSNKTFTITVLQQYTQPTDILYINATPSITDRNIINSLLTNTTLIPTIDLYRATDIYFGKATSVVYEHLYGVFSSDLDEYIAAVTQNHYWRNITLGELKTAVAKNSAGTIIYEVVYSEIIDNLINPSGVSVSSEIYWPTPINLFQGSWYTSVDDIYTSYVNIFGQEYYTSLTPGSATVLYPNSLINMRNRVSAVLGQQYDSSLLPLWMTSQQADGNTLGYTQAWVICYTKPGKAITIKNNINDNWAYKLNQINFNIDRFTVDKSTTYNYDKTTNPPTWTGLPSATPVPDPLNSKNFHVLFPHKTILPNES